MGSVHAILESIAAEMAARMTAMDSASKNAKAVANRHAREVGRVMRAVLME